MRKGKGNEPVTTKENLNNKRENCKRATGGERLMKNVELRGKPDKNGHHCTQHEGGGVLTQGK